MHRLPVRLAWLSVGLAALFLGTMWARAQRLRSAQRPRNRGVELPKDEGVGDFTKRFRDKNQTKTFDEIKSGREQPTAKDLPVIDLAAQWYTYRVTWKHLQQKTAGESLASVHAQLHTVLLDTERKAENKKFRELFTRQLVKHLREVLEEGNLIGRINAAIMLPRVAQVSGPEMIDKLAALLQDRRTEDAVRLHVIRALGEQFGRLPPPSDDKKENAARAERIRKGFGALKPYLAPALKFGENTPDAERQRATAVAGYFRREAVHALARLRQPAAAIDPKTGAVNTPVAQCLARVLLPRDPDGLPPSLSEGVEAAIGLCDVRTPEGLKKDPYQKELALYLVGRFIADRLAPAFKRDQSHYRNVTVTSSKKAEHKVKAEPWLIHGARLYNALEELRGAARENKAFEQKVRDVLDRAGPVFKAMSDPAMKRELDTGDIRSLRKLADTKIKPKSDLLFRGLEETKVDLEEKEP
jgi:hypothetical protein